MNEKVGEAGELINKALWILKQEKEKEGRSDNARILAVAITDIEKVLAWLAHYLS